jgi:hypothetical protein
VFAPLLLLIFWMGVAPQPFLDRMQPALERTLQNAQVRTQAGHAAAAHRSGDAAHDLAVLVAGKGAR